jgi:pSer/pThr/pTyr-binding forkhead associated (FHA) protein
MAASDRPPGPPRASQHPKTNGCAALEPPPSPPAVLSAEQDPPGNAPILVVIHRRQPPLLGRRFVLDRSPVLVGRGAGNHIVLQDASVSPRHVHLEGSDAAWWCVADGSTDGLCIDDRRTTARAPLAQGTTWPKVAGEITSNAKQSAKALTGGPEPESAPPLECPP